MPPQYSPQVQDWINYAKGKSLSEAMTLVSLPPMKRNGAGALAGPCPVCGGTDRFWINTNKGLFGCRGCRPKFYGSVGLLMFCQNLSFYEACERLNGTPMPGRVAAQLTEKQKAERVKQQAAAKEARIRDELRQAQAQRRRLLNAKDIWESSSLVGGAAIEYLRARGIDPRVADDQLRSHPGLPHPEGGTFPALVARVAGPEGGGVGVWRIFLRPDGSGKAPVTDAKLGLGLVKGGAVRIGGVWPHLLLAEGIETALAVRELVPGNLPCWACLSTSGLRGVVIPDDVETVDIFADGDPPKSPRGNRTEWSPSPGLSAANDLKARLESEGRRVTVRVPPLGRDWNDVLRQSKRAAA